MRKQLLSSLAVLALAGCGSLGNNYLDFSKLENEVFVDDGTKGNQTLANVCVPKTISQDASITTKDLRKSIRYACGVQNTYRKALGDRARFRRGSTIPILGLGAAALGLGIADASTTSILVTGLTGATLASGQGLFGTTTDERAYILGYDAVACTLRAAVPLAIPAEPKTLDTFEKALANGGAEVALSELKATIGQAQARLNSATQLTVSERMRREQELRDARTLVSDAEAAITNARALQAQRAQLPAALTVGVREIIGQVDLAVQQNTFSASAVTEVVRNLAGAYGTFTTVPTASPAAGDGGTPANDAGAPRAPTISSENATQMIASAQNSITSINTEMDALEASRNEDAEQFDALNVDPDKNREELDRLAKSVVEREISMQNLERQLLDAKRELLWLQTELTAIQRIRAEDQRAQAEAARDKDPVQRAFDNMSSAASELDRHRRVLADVVNNVVAASPTGSLQRCGVDPDNVTAGLTLDPASMQLPMSGGARFVNINGGVAPFAVRISNASDEGVQIEHSDPFARSFEIRAASGQTAPRDVVVIDAANRRTRLAITFAAASPASAPAPASAPGQDQLQGGNAQAQTVAMSKLAFDRLTKSGRTALQAAICTKTDGVWGSASQSAFEQNAGAFPSVSGSPAVLTSEIARQILKDEVDLPGDPTCIGTQRVF
ncbi:MAG: hypothetical protein AAFX02_03715 [Pseudomonadota bacterium]